MLSFHRDYKAGFSLLSRQENKVAMKRCLNRQGVLLY